MLFLLFLLGSTMVCVCTSDPENQSSDEVDDIVNTTLKMPLFFDARKKWGKSCPSIASVKNQGRCRSGWAMSIADVLTDRRCIMTSGNLKWPLSPMMLLSCCSDCCGCCGGNVLNAWKFVRDVGLVTGGTKSDNLQPEDGCQPYLIKPLSKFDLEKSSTQCLQTPLCVKTKCTNPFYRPPGDKPTLYKIDHFKLFASDRPEEIMRELLTNGPLQVSFHLFEDFRNYNADGKCSVYFHTWGARQGEHAAKLIGWGTTQKTKYWLLMNSFGPYWGCNGTFKIPRTNNNIFEFAYAIVAPSVSSGDSITEKSAVLFRLSYFVFYSVCVKYF